MNSPQTGRKEEKGSVGILCSGKGPFFTVSHYHNGRNDHGPEDFPEETSKSDIQCDL